MAVNFSTCSCPPYQVDNNNTSVGKEQRRDSLRKRPSLNRPLSEISSNETKRRSNRSSAHSSKSIKDKESRPTSGVVEKVDSSVDTTTVRERMSTGKMLPQTITVNLNDYASKAQISALAPREGVAMASDLCTMVTSTTPSGTAPRQSSKERPELEPIGLSTKEQDEHGSAKQTSSCADEGNERMETLGDLDKELSAFLKVQRNSLRSVSAPSPGATYAEVTRPAQAPEPETHITYSTMSSVLVSSKPPPKSKPSWLKRANGAAGAALRSKTKSPALSEGSLGSSKNQLPPSLPSRRGKSKISESVSMANLQHFQSQSQPASDMTPLEPSKMLYATVASTLGHSSSPLPLPSRDNIGVNIRGRIAAWTSAAQGSGFSRSESTQNLQPQVTGSRSIPHSASRVFGHAGSAMQKGWAGLRSRGAGSSMSVSNMSSFGQPSSRREATCAHPLNGGHKSNINLHADYNDVQGHPCFTEDMIKRPAEGGGGKVFGREIIDAAREWSVVDAGFEVEGQTEWEMKRRRFLPAVVIRSCDYLHIWGPKEEGIFRISGRSSHLAALKKQFDSGADIDLRDCHPGDLDPHSVAGIFKTYIRELPSPILTRNLGPKFEDVVARKRETREKTEDLSSIREFEKEFDMLLRQLPQAHWYLLAEIVKLLDLIPKHSLTNRMTLNALMLSLGPSLNIPGFVVAELMDRHKDIFKEPLSPSTFGNAHDLIFLGGVDIPLVAPPSAQSSTFSWEASSEDPLSLTKAKKPPKLTTRPSFTKLLGDSSMGLNKQKSIDTLLNIIGQEPPRVDVAVFPDSPLPRFSDDTTPHATPTRGNKRDTVVPFSAPPYITSTFSIPIVPSSATDPIEEVHYALGTVEERSKLFSTPIADRYLAGHSTFASLRGSSGSFDTVGSATGSIFPSKISRPGSSASNTSATNPATIIRRGAPVFFQSAGVEGNRHARSMSALPFTTTLRDKEKENFRGQGIGAGISRKRKDKLAKQGEEEGRAKRLSAGPGVLDELMLGDIPV
nr:hypothetical protein L204_06236 [Cryptococcus depauperatus CBS 7855]